MKQIKIKWLSDSHECETCGVNYATGAEVNIEGSESFTLPATAHCYDGESYEEFQVYEAILKKLGYEVVGT